jgi:hypothetical protein
MSNGNVHYEITANNRSAMTAMGQVEKGGAHLSEKLNGGIKEGLAEAFSVYAIQEATRAVMEFAKSIDDAAKRLQTTTENVQTLQRIASHSGTDLGVIEKGMEKIEAAARDALGGDKAKNALFNKVGISQKDIEHGNKTDLNEKFAQGANKLSVAEKDQAYADMFGEKLGPSLQAASEEIARMSEIKDKMIASGQIMSDADIAKLAEAKDAWDDLMNLFKVKMAPVVTTVVDAVTSFVTQVIQLAELFGTALGAFSTIIETIKPWELIKALGENIVNTFQAMFSNLWDLIRGKKSISEVFDAVGEQYQENLTNALEKGFDPKAVEGAFETVNQKLLELANEDKTRAAEKAAREKAREDARARATGPVDRHGTTSKGQVKAEQEKLASAGNIAIGGTAGVDFQFRMARTNEKILSVLEKMLEELKSGKRSYIFTKEEGYV